MKKRFCLHHVKRNRGKIWKDHWQKKKFVSFKMCEKENVRRRMWVKGVRRAKQEEERECKGKRRDRGEKNGGEREDI